MHYTLHLTESCNLRCEYCYQERAVTFMPFEVAKATVDLAISSGQKRIGLVFFGGEPLLCKDLIRQIVSYANQTAPGDVRFFYKITTNGTLLDEDFLQYTMDNDIYVALSLDGTAAMHNAHRIGPNGETTHDTVVQAAKRLLAQRPYTPVLMTINPDTVQYYTESIEFLYNLGFRYLICTPNYDGDWDKTSLAETKKQYRQLAEFYYRHTMAEDKFYFSPFEVKISSHINSRTYCHERCELGQRQLSVSPQGSLYPCVQFVGEDEYCIGNVWDGINEDKRMNLFARNEAEKAGCDICAIRQRCNHYCACLNKQTTGSIDVVSPVLCAHERIVLPIADKVAERLYKNRNALFIQKSYNDFYPLVSLVEDNLLRQGSF